MLKSRDRTWEVPVMGMEEWSQAGNSRFNPNFGGAPDALKGACPVRIGGKSGDNFKGLPIDMPCSMLRCGSIPDGLVKILLSERIYEVRYE